jgi:aminopeptidase N/puromycin-sensitive aminopeptidase
MLKSAKSLGESLTPAERVTLMNDNWTLVRLGEKNVAEHLALIQSLGTERNRAVLDIIAGQLSFIANNLVSEANRPRFESWVSAYFKPLATEYGWEPKADETDEQKHIRATVIGTMGGVGNDPATLSRARELAAKALGNPTAVDPSLLETVFGLAASSGDAAWYDKLVAAMADAKNPQEYYRYFYSLVGFRDPALHQRALQYAISPDMRNQDMPNFLGALMFNRYSRAAAWQFIKEHWPEIQKKFTTWGGAGLVGSTSALCDAEAREDVKQFFAAHPVPAAERGLRQALERIESCVAFRELQSQNLNAWLERQPLKSAAN